MNRIALKVTGAQGQGVNSVGELCGKGLKRAGYCVFGYREYMSIIKGGYSSYQLDVDASRVESSTRCIQLAIGFNHHVFEAELPHLSEGGILLHHSGDWKPTAAVQEVIRQKDISALYLPTGDMLRALKAPAILANMLITTVAWRLLQQSLADLKTVVEEQFGHKGPKVIALNMKAIDAASDWFDAQTGTRTLTLPAPDRRWQNHLFLTGSQAMGLGLMHAGCRMYVGYPMTPSSPLLSFIADKQNETGMVIKQAEDEITAAQMMSGANFMGTRAATGTSGGGFDLMTETVSLNAIIENPSVFVLAMRPGPATGLPTWTAQGDLLLACFSAHGEFPRLVVAVSDSQDAFDLMNEAFNYAEEFRIPAIILTDKHIAEGLFTQAPYDQTKAVIRRGPLITDPVALKQCRSTDYFDPAAENGVSPRWLPGSPAATFCAQGDEHDSEGNVDETGPNAAMQLEKRMKKNAALKAVLPDPELYEVVNGQIAVVSNAQAPESDMLIVSWGSNKGVILDVLKELTIHHRSLTIHYLHYTYLWPLKTERLEHLMTKAKRPILIECNYQAQLKLLLKMEAGIDIEETILKYDGRPFFFDELSHILHTHTSQTINEFTTYQKEFDAWNAVKKHTEQQQSYPYFHEREVYYARLGENVGREQCGKGNQFMRPVVVLRKLTKESFWAVPLSSTTRRGTYFHAFCFEGGRESVACLSQMRLMDAKRLGKKIGFVSKKDFMEITKKISQLLPADSHFPPQSGGRAEAKIT